MRLTTPSLTIRLVLLLLGGVVLAAVVAFLFAQEERSHVVEHFRGREVAQRVSDVALLLAQQPAAQRVLALRQLEGAEWRLIDAESMPSGRSLPGLGAGVQQRIGRAARVDAVWHLRARDAPGPPGVAVRLVFADGQALTLGYQPQRPPPPRFVQRRWALSLALFFAVIGVVGWIAVRLALRPLRRMADAAEALGHDIERPPLDTRGPYEVRQAAEAFNVMQARIRDQVAERTRILAAVTHDLKTPLTRLRLRLEGCDDEGLRQRLAADVAAMQELVDEGLELARSMDVQEELVPLDLAALACSLCDDAADAGLAVHYHAESEAGVAVRILARPRALRRALGNLLDNALKYGESATVTVSAAHGAIRLVVRDQGPGIPEAHLADVLKPFYRIEGSRSRDTGGTGLGLAIASNLLTGMGAALVLKNVPEGGLEAAVCFRPAEKNDRTAA